MKLRQYIPIYICFTESHAEWKAAMRKAVAELEAQEGCPGKYDVSDEALGGWPPYWDEPLVIDFGDIEKNVAELQKAVDVTPNETKK